ncbi:indole-3-glycerol-phosphate synthase [Phosphitispora sp. TUW77]|uniref:indole-3-glycerol-phosphate synthase n=1 Tax=Phosphitispora sp. TUW77 TaxID=3152361 RepID=UPI003AB10B74
MQQEKIRNNMNPEKKGESNKSCTKCTAALWHRYRSGKIPVIPDIKCKSPGEGDLMLGRDPVAIARRLAAAGAPVISVVTEADHFGGSPELLRQIAQTVSVPILRKDFITTREHLLESANIGASGVLLIASMLEEDQLSKLVEEALVMGLEPLVETHNEAEIIAVNRLELTFLGINNRNIVEWEMDDGSVNTTEKLSGLARQDVFLVSESSLAAPGDVLRAVAAGAHGVLVGTAILRAPDPVEMYLELSQTMG